ncbi:MAG: putative Peptidase domain protein, involved in ppq synthesis (ppqG) [Deltaproteobacteria bacterium]|nr:putative Peptidase domain protein, involved in ppq synthesis (ppqG) [Deltaproteobacteria bacterium]
MKKILLNMAAALVLAVCAPRAEASMVPKRSVLNNGMVLLTSEQRALPMVAVELLIDAGSRHEAAHQAGLANLTSKLLIYGTKKRSALQISEALDFIGASLASGASENVASVSLTILKKDLAVGLELLAEILTSSTFPRDEIDRQKQAIIGAIKAQEEDPGAVASRAFAAALFPQSPYGRPVEGAEASVKSLQAQSLKDFFTRYYRPNRSILSVVGDVSETEITQALNQALRGWTRGAESTAPSAPSNIGAAQTLRINKDLTQANIILGHNGVARGHPDYYAIQVMNYILGGGGFSSRAMDSIRNERGLAYSVYSFFSPEKSHGSFQFVMQTKNESAQEAIRIARDEIRKIREQPVSEQELNDAKEYLAGSFALRFDTNRKVAGFLTQVEYFGLGLDFPSRYTELVRKVSREDVQRVAKQFLQPDKLITVIVGNHKKITPN